MLPSNLGVLVMNRTTHVLLFFQKLVTEYGITEK